MFDLGVWAGIVSDVFSMFDPGVWAGIVLDVFCMFNSGVWAEVVLDVFSVFDLFDIFDAFKAFTLYGTWPGNKYDTIIISIYSPNSNIYTLVMSCISSWHRL